MGRINIDIPEDLHILFRKKYPRGQEKAILNFIKDDLGWCDDRYEAREKEILFTIQELQSELDHYTVLRAKAEERKKRELEEKIPIIKEIYNRGVGKKWKDNDEKVINPSLEGYTKGDIWRVLNE